METRNTAVLATALTIGCLGAFAARGTATGSEDEPSLKVLEFDVMVGVPRPFTGDANPIRGVNGGGLPWVIESAKGELGVGGKIEVEVEGLVLDPNDPAVVARGLAGVNPVPLFRAIVSCLSVDENGDPVVVNVETGLFPADEAGDSKIEDVVALPDPCIAPIVFVTSPGGMWFAATGL